jgi:hypothetical protein
MKQRITIEQLNELTDEQKKRLREWWKPQEGDFIISDKDSRIRIIGKPNNNSATQFFPRALNGYECDIIILKTCLPLLSIGQMIELTESTNIIKYNGGWALDDDAVEFHDELCDALWEAVKQIL